MTPADLEDWATALMLLALAIAFLGVVLVAVGAALIDLMHDWRNPR